MMQPSRRLAPQRSTASFGGTHETKGSYFKRRSYQDRAAAHEIDMLHLLNIICVNELGTPTLHVTTSGYTSVCLVFNIKTHPCSFSRTPLITSLKHYNNHKQSHYRQPAKEIQYHPEPSQHPFRLVPQLSPIAACVPVPPAVSAPARNHITITILRPPVVVAAIGVI